MFKNYITVIVRNLLNNKFYTTITLLGLSIGMTACFLILHYVDYQLSYDQFHEKADRIYRIEHQYSEQGEIRSRSARTAAAVGPALKHDFAEVESFVRFLGWFGSNKFTYEDVTYLENKILFVNPDFFNTFSFSIIKGDKVTGLTGPDKVMISESIARKYFGNNEPMGKELLLQDGSNNLRLTVSGVYKDPPANSHFRFDFLISYDTFISLKGEDANTSWQWTNFYTYILLKPGVNIESVRAKMPAFIESHLGHLKQYNVAVNFKLQPLTDIHLYSDLQDELGETGSGKTVPFLIIIALFILVIAWVNYVNLSTAKALTRAREVGVRKVMGADRKKLVVQFIVESILVNGIAMVIAIAFFLSSFPLFAELTGNTELKIEIYDYQFWIILMGLFVIGVFLSGLYPSFVLSSFKPVKVLKGKIAYATHGILLRKSLVTFQFIVAIILIGGTLTVYQQMKHMLNADLGASIEHTIVINSPIVKDETYIDKMNFFKDELSNYPGIKSITASSTVPSQRGLTGMMVRIANTNQEANTLLSVAEVDYDFVPAYNLKMVKGRNFDVKRPGDKSAVLLSLSACRLLGFTSPEEAMNSEILFSGPPDQPADIRTVIGITKDYHHNSILSDVLPIVVTLNTKSSRYFSFKIDAKNIDETIATIQATWDKAFEGNIMHYFFLDDAFNQQYAAELKFERIFKVFSSLAIFIACIGLLGLSAFTANQKAGEIGVRKIVGASVKDILGLLSKTYVKLLLISSLVAAPTTYYIFSNWLNNFSYRIGMEWWMIVAPCIIVFLIAIITISFYTIKAALINPVQFLRSE
jgi:putative ABC transport system permease protein